jgi:hypothetical protein
MQIAVMIFIVTKTIEYVFINATKPVALPDKTGRPLFSPAF